MYLEHSGCACSSMSLNKEKFILEKLLSLRRENGMDEHKCLKAHENP